SDMHLDASRVIKLGLPDAWVYQDSRAKQQALVGIDVAGIAKAIRQAAAMNTGTPAVQVKVASSARTMG
ncbi:MAG: hypothetical protein K2X32_04155, partial [Phycisphaerales bacterium]|nr:hypothetical protein [Phycisphaerales bacterium]